MNLLRQQILPRAAFSQDQHSGVRRGHAVRHLEGTAHLRRASNHLAKLSFGRQTSPQRIIFFFKRRQLQQIPHALPQFFQFKSLHQIVRRPKL